MLFPFDFRPLILLVSIVVFIYSSYRIVKDAKEDYENAVVKNDLPLLPLYKGMEFVGYVGFVFVLILGGFFAAMI